MYRIGTKSKTTFNGRKYTIIISKIKGSNEEDFRQELVDFAFVEISTLSTDEDVNNAANDLHNLSEFFAP